MEVQSKRCWAWNTIDDFQEPEIGEHDVRAAEACARLTYLPSQPSTTASESRTSSGKVDIGALLRAAARAPVPREQRAWTAPPVASRERIARTSTPEHVRHARQRSFVRGTLIGGTVMAAVALGPAMVSIARAPQAGPHVDRGAMEPAMVVTIDRRKTPRVAREGAPPTLTQLVITGAAAPLAALPVTGDDADDGNLASPRASAPRANVDARDVLASAPRARPAQLATLETATGADAVVAASDETVEPTNALTATEPSGAGAGVEPATAAIAIEPAATTNEPLHASAAAPPAPSSEPVTSSDAPALPPTLDRLIEDAVGVSRTTTASEATPAPAAPAPAPVTTPTRAEVDRALASARARVEECATQGHGLANVRITVAGSTGRVMSAVVEGALAGTPAGSCVARAVRGATFPPFAQASFTVQYPFQL